MRKIILLFLQAYDNEAVEGGYMVYLMTIFLSFNLMAAGDHSHPGEESGVSAQMKLNKGKKWSTDLSLRRAMEKIKGSLNSDWSNIRSSKANENTYINLSKIVDDQVQYIFNNCKLAGDSDAQLHLLMTDVMNSSYGMKTGPSLEARRHGALKLSEALEKYGQYFDHPGWTNLSSNGK